MNFQPWALQTFEGAMSQINSIILYLTSCPDYDDEQADPIICLADLLDALVEGLGPNFAELLASSKQYGEHFLNMLRTLTSHDVDGVRMSAFAIMGDIAQKCPVVIQDCLGELLVEAISCIDPMYPGVCNNAVWAIGEVCAKCRGNPSPMQPYANDIVQKLIVLLMGSQYSDDSSYGMPIQGLAENASSAMGRLSLVDPSFVTQDLSRFLSGWCDGMAKISDLTEKRDAFEGFFAAIQSKPEIIGSSPNLLNDFTGILFAIVSWYLPTDNYSADVLHGSYDFQPLPVELDDFNHKIQIFVRGLKELVGEERWVELQKHMPVNVRRLLRDNYGL
jgi:transportin-1